LFEKPLLLFYYFQDTAAAVKQEPEVTESLVRRDDQGMLVAVVGNKAMFNPIDEARRQLKKNNVGSDVGFMPLRGDYEVEYSNNAEEIVGELELLDEDTPDERKLKLKLLEMYDFKLCEREKRKNFALERGICDWKKTSNMEKKRSKEERDMYTKYRCFTRFMPQNKFDELVDGIISERRIRKRIEQLKQYRSAGVLTFKKAEQYEVDKKRRESDWEQRKGIRTPSVRNNRARANQSGFDDVCQLLFGVVINSFLTNHFSNFLQLVHHAFSIIKIAHNDARISDAFCTKSAKSW